MAQDLVLSPSPENGEVSSQRSFSELVLSDSVQLVQFSAREKARRVLLQSELKTALSQGDYEKVISLFFDNVSENLNSELADSFVSWLLDTLQIVENKARDYKTLSDSQRRDAERLFIKIIEKVSSQEFLPILHKLSPDKLGEMLKLYMSYNKTGSNLYNLSAYSNTSGVDYIVSQLDISQLDANGIIEHLSNLQKNGYNMHNDGGPLMGVPLSTLQAEQRSPEARILLRSSLGEKFDVQKLALHQVESFGYFFYWLIENYFEKVDWNQIVDIIEQRLKERDDSDDKDAKEFGLETDKDRYENMLREISEGPIGNGNFKI